jgi:hypothetical protein
LAIGIVLSLSLFLRIFKGKEQNWVLSFVQVNACNTPSSHCVQQISRQQTLRLIRERLKDATQKHHLNQHCFMSFKTNKLLYKRREQTSKSLTGTASTDDKHDGFYCLKLTNQSYTPPHYFSCELQQLHCREKINRKWLL